MKLLALLLCLAILLCGCGSGKSDAINEPDANVAAENDLTEPEIASDFSYYRGVAGTSSVNDNVFLCPYKDSFLCMSYDFNCGDYEDIKGVVLTPNEKAGFLELLEEGITPAESDDSDEDGGNFREFAICLNGEEQIIEAFDLSFLDFEQVYAAYSYDSIDDSYDEAVDAFDFSSQTREKLGYCGSEFILPGDAVTVFIANQIAAYTDERIDSAEEIESNEEDFRIEIVLENDEALTATVSYTGLIVDWEYN